MRIVCDHIRVREEGRRIAAGLYEGGHYFRFSITVTRSSGLAARERSKCTGYRHTETIVNLNNDNHSLIL